MNITKELITDKDKLIYHKDDILKLFKLCFNKDLDEKIWHWAYIDNVMGDPIVSLYFDNNKLVGHYAVIPISMRRRNEEIKTTLSMTTMVDIHYRKLGIFYEQAKIVYEKAKESGFQLVIGFPNKLSLPGFKKRLGWTICSADYVALLSKEHLSNSTNFREYIKNEALIKLDLSNNEFLNWRLSKPQHNYHTINGVILKDYKNHQDIVSINTNFENCLESNKKYNILIDSSIDDLRKFIVFNYQFGYKLLDNSLNVTKFKKDLLISDVF